MRRLRLLLLVMPFLVGCFAPPSPPRLRPTILLPGHATFPNELAPNSAITIPLPASGTPEAAPTMLLQVRVFDDLTGQPMKARVAWLLSDELRAVEAGDAQWAAEDVDILLPGEVSGWLVISAPGYEMWSLQVEYRILTSRKLEMPVRMRREGVSL